MTYASTLRLGAIGLAIAVTGSLIEGFGEHGRIPERLLVSMLRTGLTGALFVFIFEGMYLFARIGDLGLAVASWAYAAILALLLGRLAPPGDRRPSPARKAPRSRRATIRAERAAHAAPIPLPGGPSGAVPGASRSAHA